MNDRVKRLWIEALRSGNYTQGRFMLRSVDDKRCCLGVLCDVYIKEHSGADWVLHEEPDRYEFLGSTGFLPVEVGSWADIQSYTEPTLTSMNDTGSKTFAEIAGYIEKEM